MTLDTNTAVAVIPPVTFSKIAKTVSTAATDADGMDWTQINVELEDVTPDGSKHNFSFELQHSYTPS